AFLARGHGDAGSHQRKLLLVLPFQNLGRPDDDYFADGMTEEITARLGSVQDLGVIARTTAGQYKNTAKTIRQIGQELGVEYVLEGTVRWERSPAGSSRVRVSPQLIRVSDATHLWAHVYDEVLAGVFASQAAEKALQLRPELPEAHLAMGYYYYWGHLDYDRALREFAIVQAHQPNNGDVLAATAFVQRRQGKWAEALANLTKAIKLDPRSNTRAFEVGLTNVLIRRYPEAEQYLDRAIELAPEWPEPYTDSARIYLSWEGNPATAERSLLQSLGKTDRLGLPGRTQRLGEFFIPRDEAYQTALRGLSLSAVGSDTAAYFLFKAEFYRQNHEPRLERAYSDSARAVLEADTKKRPEDAGFRAALGLAYAGLNRKADAIREARRSLELLPLSKDAYFGAARVVNLAHVYALVGESEAAIEQWKLLLSIPSEISIPLLRVD